MTVELDPELLGDTGEVLTEPLKERGAHLWTKDRKPKGGRTPGTPNKVKAVMLAAFEAQGWITPMEFFAQVMNSPQVKLPMRMRAAESLAPYVHRRMPIGIDNGAGGPVQFVSMLQLAGLPIDQLLALESATSAIAAAAPKPEEEGNEQ